MIPSRGPICDTNLLSTPTPRRLFTLWMEQAGTSTALLPQVWAELAGHSRTDASPRGMAHRNAWSSVVEMEGSPFEIVQLTTEGQEKVEDILGAFTLRHFPALANMADVRHHSDCLVVAQGLACRVDMIVTNNMRSMDHHEVNQLVRERWAGTTDFSSLPTMRCWRLIRAGSRHDGCLRQRSHWHCQQTVKNRNWAVPVTCSANCAAGCERDCRCPTPRKDSSTPSRTTAASRTRWL